MDATYYLDKDGYKVCIGAIVGYEENFLTLDNRDKLYVIREMPNLANTVIMRECRMDDKGGVIDIPGATDIEVEPWKIGAI